MPIAFVCGQARPQSQHAPLEALISVQSNCIYLAERSLVSKADQILTLDPACRSQTSTYCMALRIELAMQGLTYLPCLEPSEKAITVNN